MSAINVGHKVGTQTGLCIMLEGLGHHHGTQVGTTNTDVDNIRNRLASVALPGARPDGLRKLLHVSKYLAHLGHDILAIVIDGLAAQVTQGNVENGTVLGKVDAVTAKHLVAHGLNVGILGEFKQKLEGLVANAVLGEIQKDGNILALELTRILAETLGVLGKKVLDDDVLALSVVMVLQLAPGTETVGEHHF